MGKLFFFIREAFRALRRSAAPSVAAIVTIVVTVLLLGVLIPVLQATRARPRTSATRSGSRLPLRRRDATARSTKLAGRRSAAIAHVAVVEFVTKAEALRDPQRAASRTRTIVDELNSQPAARLVQRQARRPRQPRGGPRRR